MVSYNAGTPKSSALDWEFPWNKPSNARLGYPHDYGTPQIWLVGPTHLERTRTSAFGHVLEETAEGPWFLERCLMDMTRIRALKTKLRDVSKKSLELWKPFEHMTCLIELLWTWPNCSKLDQHLYELRDPQCCHRLRDIHSPVSSVKPC